MVCPYKSPEMRRKQQEAADKAEPVGKPDDVRRLLADLASPDPEIRRRAALMFEVSSFEAMEAVREWREGDAEE